MKPKYIIGDIVEYDNKVMVVKEPRDGNHFDLSCPKEGLVYCFVDVDDIKPARLTQEILENNGWKKFKRPYSRDYCFRRKGYPTLNIRTNNEVYFHWGDHDKSITAVHQLQHILFGLGLNSEMEV